MSSMDAELENRFLYHSPTPEAAWRHELVSQLTLALAKTLAELTPASRQQSLALTHLEEVRMWANASIACNHGLLAGLKPQS